MLVVERFYLDTECRFCGEQSSHFVDFVLYDPTKHSVIAHITCTDCFELAEYLQKEKYDYLVLTIDVNVWDKITNTFVEHNSES